MYILLWRYVGEVDATSSAVMAINEAVGSICNALMTPLYDARISNGLSFRFKLSYTRFFAHAFF